MKYLSLSLNQSKQNFGNASFSLSPVVFLSALNFLSRSSKSFSYNLLCNVYISPSFSGTIKKISFFFDWLFFLYYSQAFSGHFFLRHPSYSCFWNFVWHVVFMYLLPTKKMLWLNMMTRGWVKGCIAYHIQLFFPITLSFLFLKLL